MSFLNTNGNDNDDIEEDGDENTLVPPDSSLSNFVFHRVKTVYVGFIWIILTVYFTFSAAFHIIAVIYRTLLNLQAV